MSKDRPPKYWVVWQSHPEVSRPPAPLTLISRQFASLSSWATTGETALTQIWTRRHTNPATWGSIRPTGPHGSGQSLVSLLPNSQASQSLDQASSHVVCDLRAFPGKQRPHPRPPCPLFPRAPPDAAVQLCFCQAIWTGVVRPVLHRMSVTHCQSHCTPAHPLSRAALSFSLAKEENCFCSWATQFGVFNRAMEAKSHPAHPCHPPATKNAHMQRLACWTCKPNKAQRDFQSPAGQPHSPTDLSGTC